MTPRMVKEGALRPENDPPSKPPITQAVDPTLDEAERWVANPNVPTAAENRRLRAERDALADTLREIRDDLEDYGEDGTLKVLGRIDAALDKLGEKDG